MAIAQWQNEDNIAHQGQDVARDRAPEVRIGGAAGLYAHEGYAEALQERQ